MLITIGDLVFIRCKYVFGTLLQQDFFILFSFRRFIYSFISVYGLQSWILTGKSLPLWHIECRAGKGGACTLRYTAYNRLASQRCKVHPRACMQPLGNATMTACFLAPTDVRFHCQQRSPWRWIWRLYCSHWLTTRRRFSLHTRWRQESRGFNCWRYEHWRRASL